MYSLFRRLLFTLPPEISHELSLDALSVAERLRLLKLLVKAPEPDPVELFGLKFPNRVGLAAGLDKNGDYIDALGALGFGFVEIGTVTPKPQPGNPRPRLFRVPAKNAIVNRMGFNNSGVEHLVDRVRHRRWKGVLGINVGKNLATPVSTAVNDYIAGIDAAFPHADYITVNISSPNTPGLRDLQHGNPLKLLLGHLKGAQERLEAQHERRVPLLDKIAPDFEEGVFDELADVLLESRVEGVIATNTTLDHSALDGLKHGDEQGGVSGGPLTDRSTEVIEQLAARFKGELPVIGVGGILDGKDAAAKIAAGASLVQIYTGFIYRGPELIREAVDAIRAAR